MNHYLFYFSDPRTNNLIFNIELEDNKLIVNYGEGVTVDEAAKVFYEYAAKVFENTINKPAGSYHITKCIECRQVTGYFLCSHSESCVLSYTCKKCHDDKNSTRI